MIKTLKWNAPLRWIQGCAQERNALPCQFALFCAWTHTVWEVVPNWLISLLQECDSLTRGFQTKDFKQFSFPCVYNSWSGSGCEGKSLVITQCTLNNGRWGSFLGIGWLGNWVMVHGNWVPAVFLLFPPAHMVHLHSSSSIRFVGPMSMSPRLVLKGISPEMFCCEHQRSIILPVLWLANFGAH